MTTDHAVGLRCTAAKSSDPITAHCGDSSSGSPQPPWSRLLQSITVARSLRRLSTPVCLPRAPPVADPASRAWFRRTALAEPTARTPRRGSGGDGVWGGQVGLLAGSGEVVIRDC